MSNQFEKQFEAKLPRRRWLQVSAGTLLAAGLWPGRLQAAENGNASFHFIAINDTHYSSPKCPRWFEQVTASVHSLEQKPEFCLMVGDLAQDGKREELEPIKKVLKGLGMPYHTVPGNHDYTPAGERAIYDDLFPDQLNYHFEHGKLDNGRWQFVALDSTEKTKYQGVTIQPPTFAWLEENLPKLDRKKPTVLFTHFPLAEGVQMRPRNADALLECFLDFNLVAVFNGHFHGFTENKLGDTVLTTNKCCAISRNNHDGTKEKGYFLCSVDNGKLTRRFVEVVPE